MDALALLCTLHADGPATLARLREEHCATLEDVIAEEAARLAEWMRTNETAAARFQREARHLKERVGVEAEEVAEVAEPSEEADHAAAPRIDPRRRAIERVLDLWRERDGRAEDGGGVADGAGGDRAEAQARIVDRASSESASCAIEVGAIEAGAVDGLDAEAGQALARAGVHDLHALATADALATSRASGLAYTRVVRLAALARRAAGVVTRAEPVRAIPALKLSVSERPAERVAPLVDWSSPPEHVSAREEGVGGPFAYPL